MRREDKQVEDFNAIEEIINSAQVCRVAMVKDNQPYVVPLCFGYENKVVYFHCADQGKKIDVLKSNPKVCVEFDIDTQLVMSERACSFEMNYRSVIGFGKALLLKDLHEKKIALDIMLKKYTGKSFNIPEDGLKKVTVIKIILEEITGKISGYEK
ncbi:MAG: pyridoxamine 5'-phosphate oxidase [Desulfuromonas sp. SDB]|nr:MAG: pyridoxamine 5'-phosphate oxidase [Desulfuromonas sp. SDB]